MFAITLRILGLVCCVVALTHVTLGVGGDWVVGAPVANPVDPSLDSQNRFYGAAFGLYGLLLWLCASDLRRFAPVLRVMLAMMFAAGCARGLALAAYGWPSPIIIGLWASELLLPPLVWLGLRQNLRTLP